MDVNGAEAASAAEAAAVAVADAASAAEAVAVAVADAGADAEAAAATIADAASAAAGEDHTAYAERKPPEACEDRFSSTGEPVR